MSDSDDTEVLLLIPPNFFSVDSRSSSQHHIASYYSENNISCGTCPKYKLPIRTENDIDVAVNVTLTPRSTITMATMNRLELDANEHDHYDHPQICHSTPKPCSARITRNIFPLISGSSTSFSEPNRNIIKEIDSFLYKNNVPNVERNSYHETVNTDCKLYENEIDLNDNFEDLATKIEEEHIISLDDIWNNKTYQKLTIQEEKLRREHCENVIKSLQAQLLDYQQKITVALQVDKAKDSAMKKLKDVNSKLNKKISFLDGELIAHRSVCNQLESDLKYKIEILKSEISKYASKNTELQQKFNSLTKSSQEVSEIREKQIHDLEIRLANSQHSEHCLIEDNLKLKEKLESKLECQEKRHLECELNEIKERIKNQMSCHLSELETQKSFLKTFYQEQLEKVVTSKLNEFQDQMNKLEDKLHMENKDRERLIAERALRQIQLIVENNERELRLLNEKHSEEIALYRIHLSHSTKTIDQMQEQLDSYHSKKADIAEKLHKIMESQWQKALDVIDCSNENVSSSRTVNKKCSDSKSLSNLPVQLAEETKTDKSQQIDTTDELAKYVQLLLHNSPRDMTKLEEVIKTKSKSQITNNADTNKSTELKEIGAHTP